MFKVAVPALVCFLLAAQTPAGPGAELQWRTLFTDAFSGHLHPSWTWVRERPEARNLTANGLQLRILSGTLWAKDNSGANILLRPMGASQPVATEVTVTNQPALMNEQAGLIWYLDDGNYVKLVKEMKDQPYIILGREEGEAAKTYGRLAMPHDTVQLRLTWAGEKVTAQARTPGSDWKFVGECAPPPHGELRSGVFASVLPGETDRSATFRDFRLLEAR